MRMMKWEDCDGMTEQEKEDAVGDGCLRSETGRKRDDDKTIAHKT